jgi:hypothetical protein
MIIGFKLCINIWFDSYTLERNNNAHTQYINAINLNLNPCLWACIYYLPSLVFGMHYIDQADIQNEGEKEHIPSVF